jgi:hypothetical protein
VTVYVLAGRNLLHWIARLGTDRMLEDAFEWLSRLQASSPDPESHLRAPSADSGPLRAALLKADVNGHTPAWLAADAKAPMKVYLMARLDPWSILWAHSHVSDTPLAYAAMELKKRNGKGKDSEVCHWKGLAMPLCKCHTCYGSSL